MIDSPAESASTILANPCRPIKKQPRRRAFLLAIPAKAGIQLLALALHVAKEQKLDSSFRWNDGIVGSCGKLKLTCFVLVPETEQH